MNILSAEQIRKWDAHTIAHEPVSSIELMERAATRFTIMMMEQWKGASKATIFCGMGNNGGDGLVIARKLIQKDWDVQVVLVRFTDRSSEDFNINEHRLKKMKAAMVSIKEGDTLPQVDENALVVDAIFGSGLSRGVSGWLGEVISHLNELPNTVYAVDIPSGLFASEPQPEDGEVVSADWVGTFQVPKLSFLMPENKAYLQSFDVIDIGLMHSYLEEVQSDLHEFYIDADRVKSIPVKRNKFDHKGTFGHALLVGGSKGKMGAMVLATKACLRAGAGLTTAYVPSCGYDIMQTSIPEAMCLVDDNDNLHAYAKGLVLEQYDVIGVGPGLGTHLDTQQMFMELMAMAKSPMVIDADGLNILAKHPEWMNKLPEGSILTPHPKEFERLVGGRKWENDFEKLDLLKTLAQRTQSVVLIKGAHTVIASPEGTLYFNSTGNPGMAKGGSGDALTGIITSLVSQGYTSLDATILGVYLHGLAGDMASRRVGMQSMITSDLIEQIGRAWDRCSQN